MTEEMRREAVMHLKRVTDEMRTADALYAARMEEVEEMVGILEEYARDHTTATGARFPTTLEQLVSEYAPDLELFTDTESREVTYYPGRKTLTWGPGTRAEDIPLPANYPNLPLPDQLMAKEDQREKAGYRAILYPEAVLKVAYLEPDLVLNVLTNPTGEKLLRIEEGDRGLEPVDDTEMAKASCANNLKQLGLIVKLYINEHQGYSPAGWLSAYPDYLTDPAVLRCPLDTLGTESYQYLQPATLLEPPREWVTEEEARQMPQPVPQSELPLVVCKNKHETPDGPCRNVVFADGHAETVAEDSVRWREQILPYIQAQ